MLSKVKSMAVLGINAYVVEVEVDLSTGIPSFDIVGLGDTEVKEARDRVRSAIKNSGFEFPLKKITVNLAPADTKKEGTAFDLPLAVGILKCTEEIKVEKEDIAFVGELSLDGSLRGVNGILPMVIGAKEKGISSIVVPYENAHEAAVVEGIKVYPMKNLKEVVEFLNGDREIESFTLDINSFF